MVKDSNSIREQEKINPNTDYEQHFLIDNETIKKIVAAANIAKDDVILEIGPGTGAVTKELAKTAKKVIAIEIDKRFESALAKLPKNVEIILGDAHDIISKGSIAFTKIVCSPPYKLCDFLLQTVCLNPDIKLTMTAPENFLAKMKTHPVFSSFLEMDKVADVPMDAFNPVADTKSIVMTARSFPDDDASIAQKFMRQVFYQRDKKLKNSLREAVIILSHSIEEKTVTKKRAKEIVDSLGIPEAFLDLELLQLPSSKYSEIFESLKKIKL